jgi:hypothetical protein
MTKATLAAAAVAAATSAAVAAPRSQPSGPRESFSADLDDEIPF